MMKQCVICNKEFEPYVPHAKFCSRACKNANIRNTRKLKADSLPKKKCLFCNEEVNRPRRYKYCSDKCHLAMKAKKASDREKKKVRETHARKPPKYCKTCNVQLTTTVRNYHQLEFCLPCRKQHDRERSLKFNEENKERLTTYFKENYAKKKQDPEWVAKRNERVRARRKDPNSWFNTAHQKITGTWRSRLHYALRYKGASNLDHLFTIVGYTHDNLKQYIESQFKDGMSWSNYGEWHIDHIRPISSFNYTTTDCADFKKCWALENLQPLWDRDNRRKSNKWDGEINA